MHSHSLMIYKNNNNSFAQDNNKFQSYQNNEKQFYLIFGNDLSDSEFIIDDIFDLNVTIESPDELFNIGDLFLCLNNFVKR